MGTQNLIELFSERLSKKSIQAYLIMSKGFVDSGCCRCFIEAQRHGFKVIEAAISTNTCIHTSPCAKHRELRLSNARLALPIDKFG